MFNKSIFVVSALALSSFASAAINGFTNPLGGETLKGATTIDIKWKPDGGKNVKLILKKGPAKDLDDDAIIAANIPNSGSYKWEVPATKESGADYAFAIVDLESGEVNYTGQFSLATNVAAKPEDDKKSTSTTTTTKAASTTLATKTTSAAAETTTADKEDEEKDDEEETKTTKTAKPTSSTNSTKETPEAEKPESSASALSKSPLALIFCLAGAFFYLN